MPSLDTSIKSGFITDLQIPPPGTCGHDTSKLTSLSLNCGHSILQDFEAFIRSNPLVQGAVEIQPDHPKYLDVKSLCTEFSIDPNASYFTSDKWTHYEITDHLPLLFGATHTTLVYHTAMRPTLTGFESVTTPGNGVRIHGKFDVTESHDEGGEGTLTFVEWSETRCNVLLGAYIKATMGGSHREMHERFKGRWNEEMKRRLGLGVKDGEAGGKASFEKALRDERGRRERIGVAK